MDDDLTFGASVWGEADPVAPTPITSKPAPVAVDDFEATAFDDFDDFGEPEEAPVGGAKDDDDFGDFGDFGEADPSSSMAFGDSVTFDEGSIAGPSSQNWRPLLLDPFPSRQSLEAELEDTLGPVWNYEDIAAVTTDEPIREAEGVAQILTTPSSRQMYKSLSETLPPTKPPNWTRSRIRRQHLITLGIPVNLDEVLPRANGKPLPTLEIHTRPMSAPPGARHPHQVNGTHTSHNSRSGTPQPGQQAIHAQFGPKPELDMSRINKLLQLSQETLALQPLGNLERHLAELKLQTANTSNLLTYLLQSRDALQQDSETYNGLIAEMVGEAQKLKSGGFLCHWRWFESPEHFWHKPLNAGHHHLPPLRATH